MPPLSDAAPTFLSEQVTSARRFYLLRLRMIWAAERLANSPVLVQEVAHELEVDPFHFSRMFKHVHGVSPSVFLRCAN